MTPRGRNLLEAAGCRVTRLEAGELDWETQARFWALVQRQRRRDDCWPWLGYRKRTGHGEFRISRRPSVKAVASRVAWLLANGGALSTADVVAHRCDNPVCVNPLHLFLTDQAGNRLDCVAKERHARGEGNGRARLTTDDVRWARAARAAGIPPGAIARTLGVHRSTVEAIAGRRSWRHVPGDPPEERAGILSMREVPS